MPEIARINSHCALPCNIEMKCGVLLPLAVRVTLNIVIRWSVSGLQARAVCAISNACGVATPGQGHHSHRQQSKMHECMHLLTYDLAGSSSSSKQVGASKHSESIGQVGSTSHFGWKREGLWNRHCHRAENSRLYIRVHIRWWSNISLANPSLLLAKKATRACEITVFAAQVPNVAGN